MRLRHAAVVAALALAPLAACSFGDDEPAADTDVDAPATEGDGDADDGDADDGNTGAADDDGDGGADDQGSAADLGADRPDSVRDDYPVPFPAGWELDIQGEIGLTDAGSAQLLYPNDAYDGIVAFYDDWFESQPDEFARSVVSDQVIYQLLGETYYQVTILPDHEERDRTWTLLQVSGGIQTN
ncbi:MAG: hypothetical protein R8G01_13300 [Ilumatobacteraceae bacterium]|nr:hypothetical protein [Ilumatobacteraceae bacterium]